MSLYPALIFDTSEYAEELLYDAMEHARQEFAALTNEHTLLRRMKFLPAISDELHAKLVADYMQRLEEHNALRDSIEVVARKVRPDWFS